jgi:hypothetical protein
MSENPLFRFEQANSPVVRADSINPRLTQIDPPGRAHALTLHTPVPRVLAGRRTARRDA